MARLNKEITKSQIIVFAGGGASNHLKYPVATEFLQKLREEFQGDNNEDKLFQVICRQYLPNFEYIYDYAQRISEVVERICPAKATASSIAQAFFDTGIQSACHLDEWVEKGASVRPAAAKLNTRLARILIETYGQLKDESVVKQSCWPAFLDLIHPGPDRVLSVFTTNYDLAFEDLEGNLASSHVPLHCCYTERFRGPRFVVPIEYGRLRVGPEERPVVLFHLHGCVAWQRIARGTAAPDGACAEINFDAKGRPQVDPNKLTVVWPSPTKFPFEEPFWTAHMYLIECLQSAELVVFIGYGFLDTTIAHLIGYAVHKNPDLRIVLVDSDSKAVDRAQEEAGLPEGQVELLEHSFGEDTRQVANGLLSREKGVGAGLDAFEAFAEEVRERNERKPELQPPPGSNQWLLEALSNGVHHGSLVGADRIWMVEGHSLIARRHRTGEEFDSFVLPFRPGGNWVVSVEFRLQPSSDWGGVGVWWRGMGQPFLAVMKEQEKLRVKLMSGYARMPDRDQLLGEVQAARNHWHRIMISQSGTAIRIRAFEEDGAKLLDLRLPFDPDIWHGEVALVTTELPHEVEYRNIDYPQ